MRNDVARQELEVEQILKKKQKQQLKWFGHSMGMKNNRLVEKMWQGRTTGKRKTWENSTANILKENNTTWNEPNKKKRAMFVRE